MIWEEREMRERRVFLKKKNLPTYLIQLSLEVNLKGGSWKSGTDSWEALEGWEGTQKMKTWNNQSLKLLNILVRTCYKIIFILLTESSSVSN